MTGDIGCSPITGAAMTGFGITLDHSGEFSTSPRVSGRLYAADYAVPAPAMMGTAIADMGTAYADAAARVAPDTVELGAGDVSGMSLLGGLHKWSSSVSFTDSLTFDAGTNPDTVWILQIAGSLNLGTGARVTLKNGAKASNIFWQIAGAVAIPAGAHAEGVILCKTAIIFGAGSSLNGRALAQTAVTMIATTIVAPLPHEECFFVYSVDYSLIYPFAALEYSKGYANLAAAYGDVAAANYMGADPVVQNDLIGNTWEGVHLTISQEGGVVHQPKTATSDNSLETGGFNVMSEDFCLTYGDWEVKTTEPTHTKMADYETMRNESITYQPLLDFASTHFTTPAGSKMDLLTAFDGEPYTPWLVQWGIFPVAMRAEATAAALTGIRGVGFIEDNFELAWDKCQVNYTATKLVPAHYNQGNGLRRRLGATEGTC